MMPDCKWVFNLHAVYMQNAYGKINFSKTFEKAVEKVKEYNTKLGETLCIVKQVGGECIVAVCDMLTQHVHKNLPQADDSVYVDATSNLDGQDSKLIIFTTYSPGDGLPLGFIVTLSSLRKCLLLPLKCSRKFFQIMHFIAWEKVKVKKIS